MVRAEVEAALTADSRPSPERVGNRAPGGSLSWWPHDVPEQAGGLTALLWAACRTLLR